jgi:hypothetical protein
MSADLPFAVNTRDGHGLFGGSVAYTVRDDVRVALEAALGVAVGLLITGKVPDDQGLIATGREEHVGAKVEEERIKSETILSINQPMPSLIFLHIRRYFFLFLSCMASRKISVVLISDPEFPYFSKEVAREVTQPL